MASRLRACWAVVAIFILLHLAGHASGQGLFCSNGFPGIESSGVCCVEDCGQCGDTGCSSIEGYSEDECCTSNILENNELCADKGAAPCVIETDEGNISTPPSAAPTPDSTQPMETRTSSPISSPTPQPAAGVTMPAAESSASGSATIPWSLQDTEAWMMYFALCITVLNLANLWFHTRLRARRARGQTPEDIASRSSFQSKAELHRYFILAAFAFEIGQGIVVTFLVDDSLEESVHAMVYVVFGVVVTSSSVLLRRAGRHWQAAMANAALEGIFVALTLGFFVKPSKGSTALLVLLGVNEAAIGLAIHLQVGYHPTSSVASQWARRVLGGGEAEQVPARDFDVYNQTSSADLRQELILSMLELMGNVLLPVILILLQPQFRPRSPWRSDVVTAWWVTCTLLIFTVSLTHLLPPGRYSAYGRGGPTFVSATLNSTFVVSALACLVLLVVVILREDDVPVVDFVWFSGVILGCIVGAYASHRWNMRTFWNQVIS